MDEMTTDNPKVRKLEYPNLTISADELPDIENWKVGQTYTIKVKVKMLTYTDTHKSADWNGEGGAKGGFKIVSVESDSEKNPSMMDAKEHKSYMAKEMAKSRGM